MDTHDHGVHIGRIRIVPLGVEPVGNLLAALAGAEVKLWVAPSLVPIGRAIVESTLHFSLIRVRNARVGGPGGI